MRRWRSTRRKLIRVWRSLRHLFGTPENISATPTSVPRHLFFNNYRSIISTIECTIGSVLRQAKCGVAIRCTHKGTVPLWARCKFAINTAYSNLWRRNSVASPDRRQTDRTPHLPWQGRVHTRQSWSQPSSGVGECRHPSGWSCIPFWYTPPPDSPSRVPTDR